MWTWLRRHAVPHYGTYWYHRGLREYEFIYQRKPFASIQDESKMWPLVDSVLTQLFPKTNLHWGQGKINPATLAWVIRQVENAVAKEDGQSV